MTSRPRQTNWLSYLEAARRKGEIARYHLEKLHCYLDPDASQYHLSVAVQAHFEGVVFSVMAAVDQTAQAINSALHLGARESDLFEKAFGELAPTIAGLEAWRGKLLGRDLRRLRTKAIHYSYEKSQDQQGLRWVVQEVGVRYQGSRELRDYCEAAVHHVEELIGLIPAVESELRRRLAFSSVVR